MLVAPGIYSEIPPDEPYAARSVCIDLVTTVNGQGKDVWISTKESTLLLTKMSPEDELTMAVSVRGQVNANQIVN